MRVMAWGQTDIGLKRESNQDNFLVDLDLGLFVVADGMGGHRGGEVASALAVQAAREVVTQSFEKESGVSPRDLLSRAYREANRRIFDLSQSQGDLKGMGTTMVSCLSRDNSLYFGNVGDSRVYLCRGGQLWQLTEDHSLIYEQIRAGNIKETEAAHLVAKNIITRSVGFEPDVTCDVVVRKLQANEIYILCSDGLSGLVSDQRICEIATSTSRAEIASRLIEEAKDNGGDDNVTVVVLGGFEDPEA
ncbi:MAG: Stp1/IreP family PP2C-type Ser/Thr phosphatase [Bdellovibrionales bacterium]|nr:Stp1/IreP family PP2C-type Ser/Thr phosphatase [Bdellovibrionales bacterium]